MKSRHAAGGVLARAVMDLQFSISLLVENQGYRDAMASGSTPNDGDSSTELDRVMRELRNELAHSARMTPLLETALTAQTKSALEGIARSARFTPDLSRALDAHFAKLALGPQFNQKILFERFERLAGTPQLLESIRRNFTPRLTALTNSQEYGEPDKKSLTGYSQSFGSPSDYFAKDEVAISSIGDLNTAISKLIEKAPQLRLVWRGQRDAGWGIHSSLWRRLRAQNGVKSPNEHPTGRQPFPSEEQLISAERKILHIARTQWRFDGVSALETFARIQHFGGPTRLIDVTFNPFIAAWFAVESASDDNADARLFAFATSPVLKAGTQPSIPSHIELDLEWGGRDPAWHAWTDDDARQSVDWGTGANRRLWTPPAYDPRIPAQNAAFLLDGTPIPRRNLSPYFHGKANGGEKNYWSRDDLLESSSIYAKTFSPTRKPRANRHNLAPTFTFRIEAGSKVKIREFLESRMGFTTSHIYPDTYALAQHVANMPLPALDQV